MKRNSFLQGAFVLALAAAVIKILGGAIRFLLPRIMGGGEQGSDGMGLFQYAYPIYALFLSLSAVGVPTAISKLVAEKIAIGEGRAAGRVFRVSFWILALLGAAFSVILFTGAPFIAENISRDPRAVYAIAAIAPAIFFVSVMSAFRGYFQGLLWMEPSAYSQVLEQAVRVGTIFVLASLLMPMGVEFAAAGAAFGAVTGAVAGLIYLVAVYIRQRPDRQFESGTEGGEGDTVAALIRQIVYLAAPISLASVLASIMSFIDMLVVPLRLEVAGFGSQATAMYGMLSGMAFPLMNMPAVLTLALSVSLVPAISEAQALNDYALIRIRAATALRLTLVFSIPAVVGLYLLSSEISDLIYKFPAAGRPLAVIAPGLLFLGVQQTTSGILQGLGLTVVPLRNLVVGTIWKLILTWFLTAIPAFGILGAALGTVVGLLVSATWNLVSVRSIIGPVLDIRGMFLKPSLAALAMGPAVRGIYLLVLATFGRNSIATLSAIAGGAAVYGLVLLLVGGITARDLEFMPRFGPRMTVILRRFGLLRS